MTRSRVCQCCFFLPRLLPFFQVKLVFTDISYGVHDRERTIVVREPDGTLREASWEERDRLNQVYFPKPDRKIKMPPMFELENLKAILGPDRYEYILDRNCVQFEPDHPVFIQTAAQVYEDINAHGHFEVLTSTRHFGTMVLYLVWEQKCDDLIVHFLKHLDFERAASVCRVYAKVHPDSTVAKKPDMSDMDMIRSFIGGDSLKSAKLHACLESALEQVELKKKTESGVKDAHGS